MIRFGLRLTLSGGREAAVRLAVIAAAVAIGVGMVLAILAGVNAVNTQNARYAWLNTGSAARTSGDSTVAPLWWLTQGDYVDGQTIGRVDVAATGANSPIPPGLRSLPGPGEFYASPALTALMRSTPADELADRFPGHQIGVIGPAALPAPNSLVVVVGRTPADLSQVEGATRVTGITTLARNDCGADCYVGIDAAGIDLILSVVAAGLLFPVLILIGTGTRLAAARREQRFAAMRLVGATPGQISVIATVESTVAAVAGTAAGFGLFLLSRHALAAIPFTGAPFFPSDLTLVPLDVLLVAIGIPAGAVIAARLALRRVQISPLGVTRRVTPRAPRARRLIVLAVGLGELGYFVGRRPATTDGQTAAYLSGILLTMVGLVIAGPWLTMLGTRVIARHANRPATLIAARRLSDNPQAAFRAVSGLMLALFVTSVATGVITTIAANEGTASAGALDRTVLSKVFWSPQESRPSASTAAAVQARLQALPGVRGVIVVRANPADRQTVGAPPQEPGLVLCSDLARARELGSCPAGAVVAGVSPDFTGPQNSVGTTVWDAEAVDPASLQALPVMSVVVDTDGATSTIERARTSLETALPQGRNPATNEDFRTDSRSLSVEFQQLANVVILASLPIAGGSLAVSVAGGLSDRKRPFSLLRLTGARLGTLRRVVALETVVPLFVVAVAAVGTGFLAAQLFLRSQMHYSLTPPSPGYYLVVIAGIAVALAIVASTLPLLRRITGPATARNE